MSLGEWSSERKWSETAVGLEASRGGGGSVYWSSVFVKAVFKSSFSFSYILFVTTSTVYHVDEVFGVTVNMIRDGSSPAREKFLC